MIHRLKNISALVDFECAARWESFKAAALELNKTPAAVSQQIRQLEDLLGFALFERHPRTVSLTDKGRELAATATQVLKTLNRAIDDLRSETDEAILRLSTTHSFAMKWLIPRMYRFTEHHPEFDIRVDSTDRTVSLEDGTCDIAIRYFRLSSVPDAEVLFPDHLVVVCKPDPVATMSGKPSLDRLLDLPLLYEDTSEAWLRLLAANGIADHPRTLSRRYSHAGLVVQAAVAGMGVALVPFSLAYEDLQRGHLVLCPCKPASATYGYRLLYHPQKSATRKITVFSDWIREEAHAMEIEFRRFSTIP
jgi:LysR family glycine cleavage system transcriptional activator